MANPAIESYEINVDVNGEKAILTGEVESAIEKRLAERIALKADGITSVDNRILVNPVLVMTVGSSTPDFGSFVADATLEAMVDSKPLFSAGRKYRAEEAANTEKVLQMLDSGWLLMAVAVGLMAYGLHQIATAIYRRIEQPG